MPFRFTGMYPISAQPGIRSDTASPCLPQQDSWYACDLEQSTVVDHAHIRWLCLEEGARAVLPVPRGASIPSGSRDRRTAMDIPPNQTIYIKNLYDKLQKDGERWVVGEVWWWLTGDLGCGEASHSFVAGHGDLGGGVHTAPHRGHLALGTGAARCLTMLAVGRGLWARGQGRRCPTVMVAGAPPFTRPPAPAALLCD